MSGELCLDLGTEEEKCVEGVLLLTQHLSRPGGATRSDLYTYNHTAQSKEVRET